MKQIHFKPLDEKSIQVKGCGVNKIFKSYTGNKVPGSFLFKSSTGDSLARIYCIYDNLLGWQLSFCPVETVDHYDFNFNIDYKAPTDIDYCELNIHVADDIKLKAEGEFSE